MTKQILRVLILFVAVALFALPTLAQTGETFRVTTTTLNARTGPGIEFEIVARLHFNSTYPILAYSPTRNWVLIDLGTMQAWAFRHLGEVTGADEPVMTTTTGGDTSLGQGGGGAAPVTTTTFIIPTTTTTTNTTTATTAVVPPNDYINSTIGVTANVTVRLGPGLNFQPLTFIPYGQRAMPIGRNYNGTWIQVDYEGVVGWVYFVYASFPPAIDVVALPVTG